MKKRILSLFIIPLMLIGSSVPALAAFEDEVTGTPYEILQKEGVTLHYYTVTFKSPDIENGYYRATSASGDTLRFRPDQTELELFVGDPIRTYWEEDYFNLAERITPEKIEYSVDHVWYENNAMNFEGTSQSDGGILLTDEVVVGNEIVPGDSMIVEFDPMFIEAGPVRAYRK